MTNKTKWLVAVPFTLLVAIVVPGLIAGDWLWFAGRWQDMLYVALTAGMWLAATAFVDLSRPRGKRDPANALVPLALVLSVPIVVWDRVYGPARDVPAGIDLVASGLGLISIVVGVSARHYLGPAYAPRGAASAGGVLVCRGPYRVIRHPLYLAALLWVVAWPLIPGSVLASVVTLGILLPAIVSRIRAEEADLLRVHGAAYAAYQERSWRLIPYLY